jgi:hypothetical protein
MPEWYATAHETQRGEAYWGLHAGTSEEEALGIAIDKLCCGHAVQEIGASRRRILKESRCCRN